VDRSWRSGETPMTAPPAGRSFGSDRSYTTRRS
jgi:hypothetical protein